MGHLELPTGIKQSILDGISPLEEGVVHYLAENTEQHGDLELPHAADYTTQEASVWIFLYLSAYHPTTAQQIVGSAAKRAAKKARGEFYSSALERAQFEIDQLEIPDLAERARQSGQRLLNALTQQAPPKEYGPHIETMMTRPLFTLPVSRRIAAIGNLVPETAYGPWAPVSAITDMYRKSDVPTIHAFLPQLRENL